MQEERPGGINKLNIACLALEGCPREGEGVIWAQVEVAFRGVDRPSREYGGLDVGLGLWSVPERTVAGS